MLTEGNLSKHTERHKQLNEKRDFVEEYLDSLEPSVPPVGDQELRIDEHAEEGLIDLTPAESVSQSLQHTHPSRQEVQQKPHQQDKTKRKPARGSQKQPLAIDNVAVAKPSTPSKNMQDTMKRKDNSKAAKEDEVKAPKRRRESLEIAELDVQNLDINESNSKSWAVRVKMESRTTAEKRKLTNARTKQARTRPSQDDLHEQQPHKGGHDTQATRKPLQRIENNISNTRHHHHREHRDHRHHHRADLKQTTTTASSNRNTGRSDSNKPRKILTPGSLIVNLQWSKCDKY
ncbi:hypothetical protein BGX28_009885 [Mortierella sp. GBA30]|nr:hypothetical protein BGX28_009885 [Mortierella sp. GBA30]